MKLNHSVQKQIFSNWNKIQLQRLLVKPSGFHDFPALYKMVSSNWLPSQHMVCSPHGDRTSQFFTPLVLWRRCRQPSPYKGAQKLTRLDSPLCASVHASTRGLPTSHDISSVPRFCTFSRPRRSDHSTVINPPCAFRATISMRCSGPLVLSVEKSTRQISASHLAVKDSHV